MYFKLQSMTKTVCCIHKQEPDPVIQCSGHELYCVDTVNDWLTDAGWSLSLDSLLLVYARLLVRMSYNQILIFLQCSYTVGLATGRSSGL